MSTERVSPNEIPKSGRGLDIQRIFDATPGLFLVLAPDPPRFTILSATDAYLRATRTERAAILGKGVFEVFPDNSVDQATKAVDFARASFQRVMDNCRIDVMGKWRHDIRCPESEGRGFEERFWEAVNFPVLGADGQVAYIIHRVEDVTGSLRLKQKGIEPVPGEFAAMSTDVTERKKAEEALRESEEQFRTLADSIPNLAWWANGDGYITWYNRRWYEYTGTTPEQMEGWGWQSVHDSKVLPKVLEQWKESIATGEPFEMEFPLRGADGVFRSFLTRVLPLKDATGLVVRWFGTNTEISALKRTEEALRKSEERFRSYFELGLIGMAITSPVKGLIEVNEKICEMLGYERSELLQMTWSELTHGDDLAADIARFNRVLAGEIDGYTIDKRFVRKNGDIIDATISVKCVRTAEGSVDFFVSLLQDITERKRAEENIKKLNEELKRHVDELEAANNELEAFVYSVSHDLRAPLRSISGFSEILLKRYSDKVDEKGKKHFDRIINSAEQMNKVIDDLLHLSRISRHEMHKEDVDISRILQSLIAELHAAQPGRSVAVDIQEGMIGFADARLMQVALSNLLGNAWKFTSRTVRAHIECGALDREGKTVYYVRDNGAGFDQRYAERMFLPFHRLHTEQEFEGTGIGLAIVARVISRHEGKIWAEGKINEGATFFFTLN